MLDIGQSEDWLALQVAMAPCLLGYGAIAKHLHEDPRSKREGNIYWTWIQNYVADDYTAAVKTGSGECVHPTTSRGVKMALCACVYAQINWANPRQRAA